MLVWACKPIPGDLRQPHWAGMVMVVEGVLMVGGGVQYKQKKRLFTDKKPRDSESCL